MSGMGWAEAAALQRDAAEWQVRGGEGTSEGKREPAQDDGNACLLSDNTLIRNTSPPPPTYPVHLFAY